MEEINVQAVYDNEIVFKSLEDLKKGKELIDNEDEFIIIVKDENNTKGYLMDTYKIEAMQENNEFKLSFEVSLK